jgi:glucose-1-phosphate cytidylyltransferase
MGESMIESYKKKMKVVILAGGFGTRISEESHSKPKPMIEIGEKPILWHIMKIYSSYGFNDFIICLGYKNHVIKDYFSNYLLQHANFTISYEENVNHVMVHSHTAEPWKVTLVDTGLHTQTGGRLKGVQKYLNSSPFMLTYGDGVGNIDIDALLRFHLSHNKLATVTTTQPSARFGALDIDEKNLVHSFIEKPKGDRNWINAGFFIMQPKVLEYIEGEHTILEKEPLENLAKDGQLMAFKHEGFWHPMDTLRDKVYLEGLWSSGNVPWKTW